MCLPLLCPETDADHRRTSPTVVPVKPETLRPPPLDIAIAAVFVAMTVAEGLVNPHVESFARHLGIAGVAMASLAWRRRAPLLVAALVVTANLLINPQGEFSTLLSLVLVCFTVGSETKPPRAYVGLGIVVVPFLVVSVVEQFEPSDLAAALVFFVGPWAVGLLVSSRTASAEAAVARAAQLERQAELEAAGARAEERTRIARELHDIVSHSISVVTIQTQAVRRRLGPDQAREAADLAAVEATAREALAEMRRLFGVLRSEGESPGLAPQPGLAELDRLVRQVGAGEMDGPARASRANRCRSAPGSTSRRTASPRRASPTRSGTPGATEARVLVRYAPQRLDVEVADNGRGPGGRAARRARAARHPGAGRAVRRHRDARAVARPEASAWPPPCRSATRRWWPMTTPVRVLIVDDQGMVRAGFRSLLGDEPDIEVVGEAANGEEAVAPGHRPGPRRHPHGHPDAGPRRHRRHPTPGRGRRRDPGAGADDVRPRRVRLRGPARRRLRLPPQGRPGRGAGRRDPGRRRRRLAARARRHPGRHRRVRAPRRRGPPHPRPVARTC